MTDEAAILLVGAAVFVLLAMLMVVAMSRRMAKGHSAVRVNLPSPLAKALDVNARTPLAAKRARRGFAVGLGVVAAVAGVSVALDRAENKEAGVQEVERNEIAGELREIERYEMSAGELRGELVSPDRDAPVVLIVPGSGPTDRNGDNRMGGRPGSYRLLAEALADKGVASVRVDKRGMFSSAAAGDPNAVTVEIYAEDYRAWVDAIRKERGAECVWMLGHSEGALMVSAAAQGRRDVCGLILLAGMGRPMGDVIRDQLSSNPANAPVLDQARAAISELEAGRKVDVSQMHPGLLPLFSPQVQDFLISVFALDPVETLRAADARTLIVQGTTDIQVGEADARRLAATPRSELRLVEGMNHVLKEAPADRAANIAAYLDPDLPLHPELAGVIAEFIKRD